MPSLDQRERGRIAGAVQANREYLIGRLANEIDGVVRVLQLTTCDEGEWVSGDLSVLGQRLSGFEVRLRAAFNWLGDAGRVRGGFGERTLRDALLDASAFADR